MNNRWETEGGERSRKGDAGDQCPEEKKTTVKKKSVLCSDTSESGGWEDGGGVMIDFCWMRAVSIPGRLRQCAEKNLTRKTKRKLSISFSMWQLPVGALKWSDGGMIGWGVGWWWSPRCHRACNTRSSDFKHQNRGRRLVGPEEVRGMRGGLFFSVTRSKMHWEKRWPFAALTSCSSSPVACAFHHASFHGITAHLWSQSAGRLWSCIKQHKGGGVHGVLEVVNRCSKSNFCLPQVVTLWREVATEAAEKQLITKPRHLLLESWAGEGKTNSPNISALWPAQEKSAYLPPEMSTNQRPNVKTLRRTKTAEQRSFERLKMKRSPGGGSDRIHGPLAAAVRQQKSNKVTTWVASSQR